MFWQVLALATLADGVVFKGEPRGPDEDATYLWMSEFPSRKLHCVGNRCSRLKCELYALPASREWPEEDYYQVDNEELRRLRRWCSFDGRESSGNDFLRSLMYPGTKWCGKGNRARSYDDLGAYREEDACCRQHDHCSAYLLPKTCLRNLDSSRTCNNSTVTMSHCDCDVRFRRCLEAAHTRTGEIIGSLYFSTLGGYCIAGSPTGWRKYRLRASSGAGEASLAGKVIRWFLGV